MITISVNYRSKFGLSDRVFNRLRTRSLKAIKKLVIANYTGIRVSISGELTGSKQPIEADYTTGDPVADMRQAMADLQVSLNKVGVDILKTHLIQYDESFDTFAFEAEDVIDMTEDMLNPLKWIIE